MRAIMTESALWPRKCKEEMWNTGRGNMGVNMEEVWEEIREEEMHCSSWRLAPIVLLSGAS